MNNPTTLFFVQKGSFFFIYIISQLKTAECLWEGGIILPKIFVALGLLKISSNVLLDALRVIYLIVNGDQWVLMIYLNLDSDLVYSCVRLFCKVLCKGWSPWSPYTQGQGHIFSKVGHPGHPILGERDKYSPYNRGKGYLFAKVGHLMLGERDRYYQRLVTLYSGKETDILKVWSPWIPNIRWNGHIFSKVGHPKLGDRDWYSHSLVTLFWLVGSNKQYPTFTSNILNVQNG